MLYSIEPWGKTHKTPVGGPMTLRGPFRGKSSRKETGAAQIRHSFDRFLAFFDTLSDRAAGVRPIAIVQEDDGGLLAAQGAGGVFLQGEYPEVGFQRTVDEEAAHEGLPLA